MNGFIRVLMFIYSVFIAIMSVVLLYGLYDQDIFSDIISPLPSVATGPISKYIYFAVLMRLFVSAMSGPGVSCCCRTGRPRRRSGSGRSRYSRRTTRPWRN